MSLSLCPRVVVFDVETTGFSPRLGDRIIEIGAVAVEERGIVEEFSSLISISRRIPWRATEVHGITDEMLIGQPSAGEVLPRFRNFIGNAPLCAHNARFDMSFLSHEFSLLSYSLNNEYHCTMKLSRIHYPCLRNYKLETVARHVLGRCFKSSDLHRALGDARVTARILIKMLQQSNGNCLGVWSGCGSAFRGQCAHCFAPVGALREAPIDPPQARNVGANGIRPLDCDRQPFHDVARKSKRIFSETYK